MVFYNPVHEQTSCSQHIQLLAFYAFAPGDIMSITISISPAESALCHQFEALNSAWCVWAVMSQQFCVLRKCTWETFQHSGGTGILIFSPMSPWTVYFVMTKVECFTITAVAAPTAKIRAADDLWGPEALAVILGQNSGMCKIVTCPHSCTLFISTEQAFTPILHSDMHTLTFWWTTTTSHCYWQLYEQRKLPYDIQWISHSKSNKYRRFIRKMCLKCQKYLVYKLLCPS